MHDAFFAAISTRAGALRTDDELRAELSALASDTPEFEALTARLDTILTDRATLRAERREAHRKRVPDAEGGRIQGGGGS